MQLTQRDRSVLVFGGAICALVLLVVYGGLPLIEGFKKISSDMETKSQLLSRYRARVSSKDKYLARLEENKKRIASFDPLFLDVAENTMVSSSLQDIITKIATDSGFAVQRKEFNQPKRLNPEYQRISAKIDAQCTPEQLVSFLVAVRNYPKYLIITEMSLRSTNIKNNFLLYPSVQVSSVIKSLESKEKEKAAMRPVSSSYP
jgi:hypothetical protein